MKKFLVGLLSVFILFWASLLSACGKSKIDFTLSEQSVSIELMYGDDATQSTATVNATISGGDDVRISASVLGGYENSIVTVSTKYVSSTRTDIVLTGVSEGEAEVAVRTNQGNVVKYISVTVFSSVSSMEQREELGEKKNYLVRGITNVLNEDDLISFYPNNKSRRNITWSLAENKEGLTLEGSNLTISDSFRGEIDKTLNLETVKLIATTEKGVKVELTLPVLDKIDDNIELQFSHSKNSGFKDVTNENNIFEIVPNIPTDNNYKGYFLVDYHGNLEIKAHVYDANGEESDDLIINRDGLIGDLPCFVMFANSKKTNINGNYKVSFTIGYQGYTYRVDSADYLPITIKAREKVNRIDVATNEIGSVAGSTQTLYTTYAESRETSVYGQKYYITISPSTVVDATGKYKISLKWLEAGGVIADGCPVEVWFQDITEANRWKMVVFNQTDDGYEAGEDYYINPANVYIKAANSLTEQTVERLSMTFTSVDNTDVSTTFNLRLVRSVSLGDFTFADADIKIDSSENDGNVVVKKEFTIQGQTDIDGLYIINNSNAVIFDPIRKVNNTRDSVTFEITVSLKPSSYGLTRVDTYQIAHRNGLVTNPYNIDIFQPLKWASIHLNSAENHSNSVVDYDVSRKTYSTQGVIIASDDNDSISKLMLHNATTTPLLYYFNSVNGINAQAEISVGFFDFNEENYSLEQFKELADSDVGCITIINQAKNNINYSKIASFSGDYKSIVTKSPGFTYAVISFTGKGIDDVDANGNYSFVKIIQIESFVAPMGLEVRPNSNKNISLYSLDSLATSDEALTRQDITIRFSKNDITYRQNSNIEFVAMNSLMGTSVPSPDGSVVTWRNGRYSLANIVITGDGISFTILANSTFGENIFRDTLEVHYSLSDVNGRKVYDIFTTIDIVIRNAQRIESLNWENYDKDGLYFEVGDTSPKFMILSSSPSNAKNNSIAYIITDEKGNINSTYISISDAISANTLQVNLSSAIHEGMIGYAYILPADAIYNGKIKYYTETEQNGKLVETSSEVDVNYLGQKMSQNMTYYEYLVSSGAYFISNATGSVEKRVEFSKILLRVKITVADGRSFDYAYRIYDSLSFAKMSDILENNNVSKFYTIMNSIDLTGIEFASFNEITGGIQGYSSEITVKLNGANLAKINNGEIRNITFVGSVNDENSTGFIVNTNNSNITNVTIDVNGRSASELNSTSQKAYVGGIAGVNNGTIENANVLGLTIIADSSTDGSCVGGIAGRNAGKILNSRVEFYNLEKALDEYSSNTFTGKTVGAIVGQIGIISTIDHTFAYDYTLNETNWENHVILGTTSGAFAGEYEGETTDTPTAKINYSFSVVGIDVAYGDSSKYDNTDPNKTVLYKTVLLTNYYLGYYSNSSTYSLTADTANDKREPNTNFISSGEGYLSYVNNGKPHLKELYQAEKVKNIDYSVANKEENGYYKSLSVDDKNGILFFYKLKDNFVDLTDTQLNELNRYNTISLEQLIGESASDNIIVTSSKVNIIKVIGKSLQILNTGDVDIVLSSKMDVQNSKTIHIKVVYAISEVLLSWTDRGGNSAYVSDNSIVSIQETKSRDYFVSYLRPQVYLGTSANGYALKSNDISLKITKIINPEVDQDAEGNKMVDCEIASDTTFKVNVKTGDVRTNFVVSPKIFDDANYQGAIDKKFERKFVINPTKGVIKFSLTGDSLPITPSTNASIQVEIRTTAINDRVTPVISLRGEKLESTSETTDSNLYHYHLPGSTVNMIDVLVTLLSNEEDTASGMFIYVYDVNFSVSSEYRSSVSDDLLFEGYILSTSGNSSLDEDDTFTITLTKQKFTNIDLINKMIAGSTYQKANDNTINLVYTGGDLSTILAPGNNSVLEVSVNPEFAFYDHVSLSYSGTSVSNAVSMSVLSLTDIHGNLIGPGVGTDNEYYIERARKINGDIDSSKSDMITFTPTAQEKLLGKLYFKLWINTNVNRDTIIKFTATFYDSNNTQLSFANYYLTVSYLSEAKITVDGSTTAYLAKGSSAEIKIDVLLDQKVDSLVLDGDGLQGISMSGLSEPTIDEIKGIKTYTARIYASILAKTSKESNNTLYVQATVSRKLGNSPQTETKTTVATIVLVDFKVDAEKITIDDRTDGVLNIWQGIPKTINVGYNLIPDTYVNPGDDASERAISDLMKKRNEFLKYGYYPYNVKNTDESYNYYINYKYTNGVLDSEPATLKDRLFYVEGNQRTPIVSDIANKPFQVIVSGDKENGEIVSFKGLRPNMSVECVLETYVSAGGHTTIYETYFTVYVKTYSDPDVPLLISNAAEFKNLAPVDGQELDKKDDYILTNDIVLEDYVPFDTSLISSLDGNGHTIFIKSYHIDPEATALNLALFNNVVEGTLLKNIRVNVFDGGELTVDIRNLVEFNFAGIAIENEGVITNCEVVSFYTADSAYGDSDKPIGACTKDKDRSGIIIKFVKGSDEIKLSGSSLTSNIAGFVVTNSGSITNSRVGGETITILGAERTENGQPTGATYASYLTLGTFYMIGQGNMAGFVNTNANGNISACYVKNIDMSNTSATTSLYTSGFVGSNSSTISVSYIEGIKTPLDVETRSDYAYEGSSIKSEMGYVVGFVYTNTPTGKINDCYTNILIANDISDNKIYLASGFVYENEGVIENGYSASQILNSKYTQMNFSGVDEKGDLRATGTYINCYFFNKKFENVEDYSTDDSQESLYKTGVSLITVPKDGTLFYGFAVADGENDGVWRINEDGVTLIDANVEILSNRYVQYVGEDYDEGVTGNDEKGKYVLPYSTLTYTDVVRNVNTELGTTYNPIIIATAQDFVSATGQSLSSSIQKYYNETSIWGTYRLVDNIDLSTLLSSDSVMSLPSSTRAFSGTFYGNSFAISGISITSESKNVAFGLFSSIEKRGRNANPIVKNLNLEIEQVVAGETTMVGGLAGYAINSVIASIDVTFVGSTGVNGLNFVGGLLGFASGNNIIKNINISNPTVTAEKYVNADSENHYFVTDEDRGANSLQRFRNDISNNLNYNTPSSSSFITGISNYSYAGGVIGFVDNYSSENTMFDVYQAQNYSINSARVSGVVNIEAQVVGGAFGLTSYQTNIRDIGVTVSSGSKILATKYFAGGVIGQSFSSINRIFADHDTQTQEAIEDNMGNFYSGNQGVERGILDLFYLPGSEYRQIYVGGLIGYAGSGNIEISYSRLNVTSPSAEFAGGVIGGLEVQGAGLYQTHSLNNSSRDSASVNYFINEVYATGDVRADTSYDYINAGGIIGRQTGKVAFLSVNALNYITTYNYLNNLYDSVPDSSLLTNLSNYIKVNSLVGQIAAKDEEGNITEIEEINATNYKEYLFLLQYASSGSGNVADLPSVAYYEGYYKATNVLYTLNVFARIDGSIRNNNNPLFNVEQPVVNVINSPSDFADSSTGHSYTQSGFINSGVWSPDNWDHEMVDLVPTIKFKQSINVLYLDQYNVKEVFEQMSNSNATVIVRGKESEQSDNYGHIDLTNEKIKSKLDGLKITNFRGKLIRGKEYYTTKGSMPIKIIANGNFIESVGAGFSTSDLIIDYIGVKGKDDVEYTIKETATGLFINGNVSEASISSLTLNIDSPIYFFPQGGGDNASVNIGLIAGSLSSTSVRGVNINYINSDNKGYDKNLINIIDDDEFNFANLNMGLVAGSAIQTSTISLMSIENIEIDFAGSFFNIAKAFTTLKLGGYVGEVKRQTDAQPFNMVLSEMKMPSGDNPRRILISGNNDSQYYIGGYIGVVGNVTEDGGNTTGIDTISTKDGGKIDINIDFEFSGQYGNLYVGGVVGYAKVNSFVFNANSSALRIRNKFQNVSTVGSLYAGGLCGYLTGGAMSVSNFAEINFEVYAVEALDRSAENLDKNQLKLGEAYSEKNNLKVTNAYTGGVVGYAESAFSYSCDTITYINKETKKTDSLIDKSYYPSVRLNVGDEVNVGSLVGYTQALAINDSLKVTGTVISTMEFMVVGSGKANVGGMVGTIKGDSSSSADSTKSNSTFGAKDGSSILAFNGAVYSNIKTLLFGGVVGKVEGKGKGNTLNIYNTSFGGVVKVYGSISEGANITAGGVVGNVSSDNEFKPEINGIYNYGDVYVEYAENKLTKLTKLTEYYFGGVIGNTGAIGPSASNNINYTMSNIYSLMTSFNTRYQTPKNTAHALFGGSTSNVKTGYSEAFYNHAVVLLTDENGVDASYSSGSDLGYDSGIEQTKTDVTIKDEIIHALGSRIDLPEGHKLYPYSLNINDNKYTLIRSHPYLFNGRSYYLIGGSYNQKITDDDNGETSELNNVAVFGDRSDVKFENNASHFGENTHGLFDSMEGYSSISGIAIDANIVYDEIGTGDYGVLVGEMSEQSIVYAINVRGTLDVGGTKAANVSGIVGKLNSGHIYDVSTDLDIRYRAAVNGNVYGLTHIDGSGYKRIEDSFTGGSIQTLISANVTAFANLHETDSIANCYAYPKLDIDDYTQNDGVTGTITVFGEKDEQSPPINLYYDKDGLDYPTSDTFGAAKKFSDLRGNDSYFSSSRWTYDYDFNYGYPTLGYKYLNVSSYATLSESKTKKDRLTAATSLQISDIKLESEPDESYDKYIHENTYARLGNGIHPYTEGETEEQKEYYFMIPNVALLVKMNEVHKDDGLTKNFILKYDIDLDSTKISNNKLSEREGLNNNKDNRNFSGIFDGQNKTIKNLGNGESLFTSIWGDNEENKAKVMNLRLTDIYSTQYSALARDSIENAEISNIMLSGDMTIDSQAVVGGLTQKAKNSELYAITNTIKIDVVGKADGNVEYPDATETKNFPGAVVGGIVGEMQGSTMRYCSNYGPINLATGTDNQALMAGGLVGITLSGEKENTIAYSYNSTSVLTNYASTINSGVCTSKGMFFAGGLVGYIQSSTTEIKYSYNSGMIKAGNKSNTGSADLGKGSKPLASYAGGIAGFIEGGKLTYCYNEGAVEALGANPDTGWYFDGERFNLIQESARNVYAYGLAYIQGSATISNCKVVANLQDKTSLYDTIVNNGSALATGSVINNTILWETVKGVTDYYEEGEAYQTIDISTHVDIKIQNHVVWFPPLLYLYTFRFDHEDYTNKINVNISNIAPPQIRKLNNGNSCYDDLGDDEKNRRLDTFLYNENEGTTKANGIYNMQKTFLNLPTKVVIPVKNKVTFAARHFIFTVGLDTYYYYDYFSTENGELEDIDREYWDLASKDGKEIAYNGCESTDIIQSAGTTDIKNLKLITRSMESLDNEDGKEGAISDSHKITISGNTFYLAEGDNFNSIFNAGTYIASSSVTFTEEELPYVPNIGYYNITVTSGDQSYTAGITSVTSDGNNTTVSFNVFSKTQIQGNFIIDVKLDYSETVELNLSDLKYYYHDDYSIGLRLPIRGYRLRNYELKSLAGGRVYTDIIKVSKTPYEYQEENGLYIYEPSDEAENNFIYLAFEENGSGENDFIYIPNAQLKIPGAASKKIVNVDENFIQGEGPDLSYKSLNPGDEAGLAANIKKAIDNLLNSIKENEDGQKVLYERKRSVASTTRSLTKYMTQLYTNKEDKTLDSSLGLEFVEKLKWSDIFDEIKVNPYDNYNEYSIDIKNNRGRNIVAVDSSGNVIFAIDSNQNIKHISTTTINGGTCELSSVGNQLKIKPTGNISGTEGDEITKYFRALKYYANSSTEMDKTVYQYIKEYLEEQGYENVSDNGESISYQYRVYLGDKENNKGYIYIDLDMRNINIKGTTITKDTKLSEVGAKSYTLGGVTVYYDDAVQAEWQNYSKKTAGFATGSVMNVDESETSERIDVVYKANIKINEYTYESNRSITEATKGSVIGLTLQPVEDPVTKISMELTAYPTYRLGSYSKEESYAYKFLIKDKNDAYYLVELEEIEDEALPKGNGEGDDISLSLENIRSVTRFYFTNGVLDYYLKTFYNESEEEPQTGFSGGTLINISYYINELNGNGEQNLYSFQMLNGKPYMANIYFNSKGEAIKPEIIYKRTQVRKNGSGEPYFYNVANSGSVMYDENGFLVFEDEKLNGKYILSTDKADETILKTVQGDVEISVYEKVVDKDNNPVGTLKIVDFDNKEGSNQEIERGEGKYVVEFTNGEVADVKLTGGEGEMVDLSRLTKSKKDVFGNDWVIYGPNQIKFEAETKSNDDNLYLAGLNINNFNNKFKLAKQSWNEGSDIYYIYFESKDYTIEKSISTEDNEYTFESQVEIPQIEYKPFNVPKYSTIDIKFSLNVNIDKDNIKLYQDKNGYRLSEARYTKGENDSYWQIFLKGYGAEYKTFANASLKASATKNIGANDEKKIEALTTPEAASIIFVKDISFSNLAFEKTISKDEDANIIGNGYFISYFDTGLFNDLPGNNKDNTWIRDVNFLGEINGSAKTDSLLLRTMSGNNNVASNNVEIINSKIYGTFTNNLSGTTSVYTRGTNRINFTSFKSYVSVNTLKDLNRKNTDNSMCLFGTGGKLLVTNYGVIDLEDGELGKNGALNSGGDDGGNGMSLKFAKTLNKDDTLTNDGIVKLGVGGVGGAGGNTQNDVSGIGKSLPKAPSAGKNGKSGIVEKGENTYSNEGVEVKGTKEDEELVETVTGKIDPSKCGAVGRLALNEGYERLAQKHKRTAKADQVWVTFWQVNYKLSQVPTITYIPLGYTNSVTTETALNVLNELQIDKEHPSQDTAIIKGIMSDVYNLQGNDCDFVAPK